MDAIGQSVVRKLRALGFTDKEIQYQFTGPWDAQAERELGGAEEDDDRGNNGRANR